MGTPLATIEDTATSPVRQDVGITDFIFIRIASHRAREKVNGRLTANGYPPAECYYNIRGGYAYRVPATAMACLKGMDHIGRRIPGVTRARKQVDWSPCWSGSA